MAQTLFVLHILARLLPSMVQVQLQDIGQAATVGIATIDSLSGTDTGVAVGNYNIYYIVKNTCGLDTAASLQSLQVTQGTIIQPITGDSIVCNGSTTQLSRFNIRRYLEFFLILILH